MTGNDDTDDNNSGEEILTTTEFLDRVNEMRQNMARRRMALDILLHATQIEELGKYAVVCDEQREQLNSAIEAVADAADAIWPDDGGIPDIDQFSEE